MSLLISAVRHEMLELRGERSLCAVCCVLCILDRTLYAVLPLWRKIEIKWRFHSIMIHQHSTSSMRVDSIVGNTISH